MRSTLSWRDLSNERPVDDGLEERAVSQLSDGRLRRDQVRLERDADGVEVILPNSGVRPSEADFRQKVFGVRRGLRESGE